MKTLVTIALCIAAVATLEGADDIASKAATLFEPYHQAVCKTLNPWKDGQKANDLMESAAKVADEHVPKLKRKLHELAALELKELELRKYNLNEDHTHFEPDFDATKFRLELLGDTSLGMLVYEFWSPKQAGGIGLHRRMVNPRLPT